MCLREQEIGGGVWNTFLDAKWTVCMSKVLTEQRVGESGDDPVENEMHSEEDWSNRPALTWKPVGREAESSSVSASGGPRGLD